MRSRWFEESCLLIVEHLNELENTFNVLNRQTESITLDGLQLEIGFYI